MLLCIVMW